MDSTSIPKTDRTIFVGKLPHDVNERELDKMFYNCGRIVRINIKRGFAFIEFETEKDADVAIRDVNGQRLGRENVIVERARGKKVERTECFTCGKTDHWAKNCPMGGRGRLDYKSEDSYRRDYRPRGDYYLPRTVPRSDYRREDYPRDDYRPREDYYRQKDLSRRREYVPRERYPRDISPPLRRYERRDEEQTQRNPQNEGSVKEEEQNKMEE